MCTYIVEHADLIGSAKGREGWFPLNRAHVAVDHPVSAPLDHAILIDFVNEAAGPTARVGVELSASSARELVRAIQAALAAGEEAHALDDALVSAPGA
jgi:hypothetical protein